MTRVAVLLTCHNRADRTVGCLESLRRQADSTAASLQVVLVDAASTDGTADIVAERFPDVTVLRRGDDLFWNGGMRVALAHAYGTDPDLYLWLNDDVELDHDATATLLCTHEELQRSRSEPCIVVGSTRDPETADLTYGGVIRPDRRRPLHYERVEPSDRPQQVETMNGNCVLVPREIVARIGNLAAAYTHGMGDYDYGHRATRARGEVWITPGTIGTCARNPTVRPAASFDEHRRRATSPTGGLPPAEWFTFARRWAGPLWPMYAVSPYLRQFARWARSR
ncbi:glycosyltransferase family 2 protein [Nitriliruptor alkaliphilus]|uniref:glycosyltransferase family 2 protein n=1 Tax=Nitriliruptor alkaliphilus TaxID=427918 RepID=UPI0006970071|nr:glycosyltransferase family 2 protein [Nitriliruptor alkaliphilus]